MVGKPPVADAEANDFPVDYVMAVDRQLQEAHEYARQHLKHEAVWQKKMYDRNKFGNLFKESQEEREISKAKQGWTICDH